MPASPGAPRIDLASVRRLRLRAQGLAPRSSVDATGVCRQVAGVQAQEPAAGALSIRARTTSATPARVNAAWAIDRSIVQAWTLRGTLHFHAAEDLSWLLPALGGPIAAKSRTRREQLGAGDAAYRAALPRIRRVLAHGPASRAEIAGKLEGLGFDTKGQGLLHLLHRAALEGIVIRGPLRGRKETYALLADWLPDLELSGEDEALATLARRFFDAYGPASRGDLAAWCGLPKPHVDRALRATRDDLLEVDASGTTMWLPRARAGELEGRKRRAAAVNLLGRWDTYLISYANREIADPDGHVRRLSAGGGIIHPAILVDGTVRGAWQSARGAGTLDVTWFGEPTAAAEHALAKEVASVERWLASAKP